MPFLIDGHNLIGQLPDLALTDPNDEALLVQKLISFVARTKSACVVVFDHGLPGGTSRMSTRGVRVVFASQNSSADRVMIDRIHKERNPQQWTVVSSDNEVLFTARRRKMQTLNAPQFIQLMQRPAPPEKPGRDESAHVHLTEAEIDEWLNIFGVDKEAAQQPLRPTKKKPQKPKT